MHGSPAPLRAGKAENSPKGEKPIPRGDEREQGAHRAEARTPLPQQRHFQQQDCREYHKAPCSFVKSEQVPNANKNSERKTNGTHKAEYRETEDGAGSQGPRQH